MPEPCIQLSLNNGLAVRLYSSDGLSAASACIRAGAGSIHEPDRWPGLAHLLEHLLFQGGEVFRDQQRLMPWVTGQQGRVNATTGLCDTLCYFSIATAGFPGALARLLDMVAAPLFDKRAISREIGVIDAEYTMLSRHVPTLINAFLRDMISQPGGYSRFIAGNRQSLDGDISLLQQALRAFHHRYYRPDNLQLILRAPLPLSQLRALFDNALLAAGLAGWLAPAPNHRRPRADKYLLPQRAVRPPAVLQLDGEVHHCLDMIIGDPDGELRAAVPLLRTLISDAAPGSLCDHWRRRGFCRQLAVEIISAAEGYLWLMVRVQRPSASPLPAGQLNADLRAWLQQLTRLPAARIRHYQGLALQHFRALNPMEQVRQIASGTGPSDRPVKALATALLQAIPYELQTSSRTCSEQATVCGFACRWQPLTDSTVTDSPPLSFVFYPQTLNAPAVAASGITAGQWQRSAVCAPGVRILLRPADGTTLTPAQLRRLEDALLPVFSRVSHAGGESGIAFYHNIPWLFIALPDSGEALDIVSWLAVLWPPLSGVSSAAEPQQIVIRRLLAEFPSLLLPTTARPCWQGVIQCDDRELFSTLMARLPPQAAGLTPATATISAAQSHHHPPDKDADNGILFFLPLPDNSQTTVRIAKALAAIYQPAFYHWLREELSAGYVVSCRFEQYGEMPGILCAVQSPGYPCDQLATWCRQFFSRMTPQIMQLRLPPAAAEQEQLHADRIIAQIGEELWQISGRENLPSVAGSDEVLLLQQLHLWLTENSDQALQLTSGRW